MTLAVTFVGPLLFDEGVWASEALLRPVVTLDGEKVDFAAAKVSYNAPPGRLLQMFDADGVRLSFNLHYEYESRAVIHVPLPPCHVTTLSFPMATGVASCG